MALASLNLEAAAVQMLGAMLAVRLLFMPIATIGLVKGFTKAGWLPSDPICSLAMLLQAWPRLLDSTGHVTNCDLVQLCLDICISKLACIHLPV